MIAYYDIIGTVPPPSSSIPHQKRGPSSRRTFGKTCEEPSRSVSLSVSITSSRLIVDLDRSGAPYWVLPIDQSKLFPLLSTSIALYRLQKLQYSSADL
jgi:hypothetical protein